MQRKEIDRQEYEAIAEELTERTDKPGFVPIIEGVHEDHGRVLLIQQTGRYWCDADDVSLVRAFGTAPEDGVTGD